MSAVRKGTLPSKSITTGPPCSVNIHLLLKCVPCSKRQPWFNPMFFSVYTCLRDSCPYIWCNLAHPLPSSRFSSTTNISGPEANSKVLNPFKTSNYNCNFLHVPQKHIHTKYNIRQGQLLVSTYPQSPTKHYITNCYNPQQIPSWRMDFTPSNKKA